MAITPKKHLNRTRYISSKKGVITFVFSKLAFLIFGIIIASAFFHIIAVQKNIEHLDRIARTSDSILNIINMVSASQFETWVIYEGKLDAKISFQEQNFTIYTDKSLTRTTHSPINANASETDIPISCLNISNTNLTVIKRCQ